MKKEIVKKADKTKLDLEEELKVAKKNLEQARIVLNGGEFQLGAQLQNISSAYKKISNIKRDIRIFEIQRERFSPAMARWNYENNEEWKQLQKDIITDKIEELNLTLKKVEASKVAICKEIPRSKAKINQIERKLGQKQTKFKNA